MILHCVYCAIREDVPREDVAAVMGELAALLFKDNPTVTRILDLLCEKNLTRRSMHPSDRRSFVISLTREGRKKVAQLKPRVKEVRLRAWEGLTQRDFLQFRRILNTIYKNLG